MQEDLLLCRMTKDTQSNAELSELGSGTFIKMSDVYNEFWNGNEYSSSIRKILEKLDDDTDD